MSKWKVYVLYFADADDPFDRCYCGKWRFQGVAYADSGDKAIRIVKGKRIRIWDDHLCSVSYGTGGSHRLKRREWAGVLWRAERV